MRYIFLLFISLVISCGAKQIETKIVEVPQDNPNPGSGSGSSVGVVTFDNTIKPAMQRNCASSVCHSGAAFTQNLQSFLASNSCRRMENGTMPPANSPNIGEWTDSLKQTMLAFCRDKQ